MLSLKSKNLEEFKMAIPKRKNDIKVYQGNELMGRRQELLDKIIGYMEKKYISGPMKLAKEIILKNAN